MVVIFIASQLGSFGCIIAESDKARDKHSIILRRRLKNDLLNRYKDNLNKNNNKHFETLKALTFSK